MRVFISYARENAQQAAALAVDLDELGYQVWFDKQLTGGQSWWDEILRRIADCDAFVVALSPQALDSPACDREWRYAIELGRNALPVLISGEVATELLPPQLAALEYIDYRKQDKAGAIRLMKALNALPATRPLPDPMPAPPAVPMSYLGSLREQMLTSASLGFGEQSAILVKIRQGLRDKKTRDEVRQLLRQFRARDDLLARIADDVDELLAQDEPVGADRPPARGAAADRTLPDEAAGATALPSLAAAPPLGDEAGQQRPQMPKPAATMRPTVVSTAWRTALVWAAVALVLQFIGVLLVDVLPHSTWFVAAVFALTGAAVYPLLLRGFGSRADAAGIVRGGASWLGAALVGSAARGLMYDMGIAYPPSGLVSAGAALFAGGVFGATGAMLMLTSLRIAAVELSQRARKRAVLAWAIAFGLAFAIHTLLLGTDWPPLMAVAYYGGTSEIFSWLAGALLRPMAWTAGLVALLTAPVDAHVSTPKAAERRS